MKHAPDLHHRHSIRLKDYDYAQPGAYFVTVCTRDRECLLGEIADGELRLNPFGVAVRDEWLRTAELRERVDLDVFVVMPNHLHGIVMITQGRGVWPYAPTETLRSPSHTVGAIVRGFKSASAKRINEMRNTPRMPVWQRNYYEHVIRNEAELNAIRQHIHGNQATWSSDENCHV
ncbi:MAG: transposase [Dehalococcoidia bacterium]|nr:transposase [Dehalococcoidia bacterium]